MIKGVWLMLATPIKPQRIRGVCRITWSPTTIYRKNCKRNSKHDRGTDSRTQVVGRDGARKGFPILIELLYSTDFVTKIDEQIDNSMYTMVRIVAHIQANLCN